MPQVHERLGQRGDFFVRNQNLRRGHEGLLLFVRQGNRQRQRTHSPPTFGIKSGITVIVPDKSSYRNVWSAAELQTKNEEWQMVCANVFGLWWSQRLRAMMDIRSPSSL